MERRDVLRGLGVATAAALSPGCALWPGWLKESFACEPSGVLRGSEPLAAALQRARDGFKPLLILVIPEGKPEKELRGQHLGEWLNYGADEDLAALACAEVACAEMAAVRQLFPCVPSYLFEPVALVAGVDRAPARMQVALGSMPQHYDLQKLGARDEYYATEHLDPRVGYLVGDAFVDQCIARTGARLRQAILGDPEGLRRRAAALLDRIDSSGRDTVERLLGGGEATTAEVLQYAPALAAPAASNGGRLEPRTIPALAFAARAVYSRQPVPGSRWAVYNGCIEFFEDEPRPPVECGMGAMPHKSRRFLSFFTESSQG